MPNRSHLSAAEIAFVHASRVAHLATADDAGNPHVVPVCYAFDGTRFLLPLDEKPKRAEDRALRRVRNIEIRPEVALVVDRYTDSWSELAYILVHGHAVLLEPDDSGHASALVLLRERYHQYRRMALEVRAVIAITPHRVVSWGSIDK
jgi:PPOX class probable F420-dependent enzyme